MSNVTILDYGIGNILSVSRAFEFCGAKVTLTDTPEEALRADRLILPGVGAFKDGMLGLEKRGLIEAVQEYVKTGKPFLGICLGMQMMMDESEEFGLHKGLGLISGKVVKIADTTVEGLSHKIPHIGWNGLKLPDSKSISWWKDTMLENTCIDDMSYFVHSFTALPYNQNNRLADAYYGGRLLSAVIREGNAYGTQFHPEKSGKVGLNIIQSFLKL